MNAPTLDLAQSTAAVQRLLCDYANALDEQDLDRWAGLFAAESAYIVCTAENHAAGLPVRLADDDCKAKINDRVRFIREFWAGSYNDYTQRHILSVPTISPSEEHAGWAVAQSFALYVTETDMTADDGGATSLLCVGRYAAIVVVEDDVLRFRRLQVILDTAKLRQSFVYPI